MNLIPKIKQIFSNRVVLFMITRYLTYFIQFASSIFIASKLGPYYFGIYGFLIMLLNYFQIVNFGIPTSTSILLVQNRYDEKQNINIETTSIILVLFICLAIMFFAIYYHFVGIEVFDKYKPGNLIYIISFIAIFTQLNTLFSMIYRVKGSLLEVAFYQTIVPTLVFIVIFIAKDKLLLFFIFGAYLFGNLLSFIFFIYNNKVSFSGHLNIRDSKIILRKGFYLFIYSVFFSLIILSTRTIVSVYYTIEQFGYFTFAYTLAHSVILFFEAFTSIVFPKLLSLLDSDDSLKIEYTIKNLRLNYVTLLHGSMYVAMIFFPVLFFFVPKYSNAAIIANLLSLTLILYTNSFGYNSLLLAKNKEHIVAANSIIVFIFNVTISLFLVLLVKIRYEFIIITTAISYFIFAYLCVYFGKKTLCHKTSFFNIMNDCFPRSLLIPFIVTVVIITSGHSNYIFISFLFYLVFNLKNIKLIFFTFKKILLNPKIVDV